MSNDIYSLQLAENKKQIAGLAKENAALKAEKEGLNEVIRNIYTQLENSIAECQRLNILARDAYGS